MTRLPADWPSLEVQHSSEWSCSLCGDTGDGGVAGYARHYDERPDHHLLNMEASA